MRSMNRRTDRLEARLRAARAEAPPSLIDGIAERVDVRRPANPRPGLVRAAVVTAVAAALFGVSGGLGYASSAVSSVASAVVSLAPAAAPTPAAAAQPQDAADDEDGPAKDQYKPGKGCGDDNHVHARENECKRKAKGKDEH
jgi:hypothetical protein